MARIAALRAEISTERSEVSRLAHDAIDATVNDKTHGIEVHKRKGSAWQIAIRTVSYISSGGASYDASPIARVTIGPDDLARLAAGTHRLAVAPMRDEMRDDMRALILGLTDDPKAGTDGLTYDQTSLIKTLALKLRAE